MLGRRFIKQMQKLLLQFVPSEKMFTKEPGEVLEILPWSGSVASVAPRTWGQKFSSEIQCFFPKEFI